MVDPEFATKYVVKNNGLVKEPGQDSDVSVHNYVDITIGKTKYKFNLNNYKLHRKKCLFFRFSPNKIFSYEIIFF